MARNPLYPRTAGETAVDRFLNETLPRLAQARSDRRREQEKFDYEKERDALEDAKWKANWTRIQEQDDKDDIDNWREIYLAGESQAWKMYEKVGDPTAAATYLGRITDSIIDSGYDINKVAPGYESVMGMFEKQAGGFKTGELLFDKIRTGDYTSTDANNLINDFIMNPNNYNEKDTAKIEALFNQKRVDTSDTRWAQFHSPEFDLDVHKKVFTWSNDAKKIGWDADAAGQEKAKKSVTDRLMKDTTFYTEWSKLETDEQRNAIYQKEYDDMFGVENLRKAREHINNIDTTFTPGQFTDVFMQFSTAQQDDQTITAMNSLMTLLDSEQVNNLLGPDATEADAVAYVSLRMAELGFPQSAIDKHLTNKLKPFDQKNTNFVLERMGRGDEVVKAPTEDETFFKNAGYEFNQSEIMEQKESLKNLGTFVDGEGNEINLGDSTVSNDVLKGLLDSGLILDNNTIDVERIKGIIAEQENIKDSPGQKLPDKGTGEGIGEGTGEGEGSGEGDGSGDGLGAEGLFGNLGGKGAKDPLGKFEPVSIVNPVAPVSAADIYRRPQYVTKSLFSEYFE